MQFSLLALVVLFSSLTSAIHFPFSSLRIGIGSLDTPRQVHPSTPIVGETKSAPPAYHSALPLGSHPLSGGFGITLEDEMNNVKQDLKNLQQEMKKLIQMLEELKALIETMSKNLDRLKENLNDWRESFLQLMKLRVLGWSCDNAILTALKKQASELREDQR